MIAFRCPSELAAAAQQLAESEDRTLSNFLKKILRDALERERRTEEQEREHSPAA